MSSRWASFIVSGETVIVVLADVDGEQPRPLTILSDAKWNIDKQRGPITHAELYRKCQDYLAEHAVTDVVVKATYTAQYNPGFAFLEAIEFRGILIAAAAGVCDVTLIKKSVISKTYGELKVDEYVKDDAFWTEMTLGGVDLDKVGREAAMFMLAMLKDRQPADGHSPAFG